MNRAIKLGAYVKSLRKELGYTVQELAEKTDISRGYISNIETGKKIPAPEKLKALAEHFPNTSYAYLLEEAGYKELAAYEKMKQIEEDFIDEVPINEVSTSFLNKVQDVYHLLKAESYELIEQDIKPKYKGRELSPAEREQVLKMLEVLFPEA